MDLEQSSFLLGANAGFLADLYQRYLENPSSVDPSWAQFFAELQDDPRALSRDFAGASWALREQPQRPSEPAQKPNGNGALVLAAAEANGGFVGQEQLQRAARIPFAP